MKDEVHIEDCGGHLYVRISGMYSFEKLMDAIEMLDIEYQRKPFSRLLVDTRFLNGQMGAEDRIDIGAKAMQFNCRNVKVALLSKFERITSGRFLVDYLSHRGTQIRLVGRVVDATTWLLG